MKLLVFLLLFNISMTFEKTGKIYFFISSVQASEVADSYQVRLQKWLQERQAKDSLKRAKERVSENRNESQTLNSQRNMATDSRLSQTLPSKQTKEVDRTLGAKTLETASSRRPATVLNRRRYLDAQEEFLNNIPKDNSQVQALLTMIDHSKVYFSINKDGQLKDFLKDDRFREIYTEEMNPESRRMTYNFFKGYQDHHRNPNEPIALKLNRDIKVTREKIDSYLETTGMKSKLTRSLTGKYPSVSSPRLYDDSETSSSSESSEVAE